MKREKHNSAVRIGNATAEKKPLKITFINPNTEEEIVQAMAGVLAYNLANKDQSVEFEYSESHIKKKREYER